MAKEIRIVTLVPGQQVPAGCQGVGYNGGIMWEGEVGTFPAGYSSVVLSLTDYKSYLKGVIRQSANNHLADDTMPDDPWFVQRNVAMGLYPSEVADKIKQLIVDTITESNRCEDLIDAATAIEGAQAIMPSWSAQEVK